MCNVICTEGSASQWKVGIAAGVLERIQQAEEMGIHAAWVTTGGTRQDALTVLAAATTQTQRILLGASITPRER
jgi:alkanesulfonate monooxygenase SsuD/methylene tetrahydromethanopterin reductase-like flavin-dependent oxidoreductase (luciferase family)